MFAFYNSCCILFEKFLFLGKFMSEGVGDNFVESARETFPLRITRAARRHVPESGNRIITPTLATLLTGSMFSLPT